MASALDMVAGVGQFGFDPLGDFYEGRKTGNAMREMKRADQARPLIGQALQGDGNALRGLAGIDPDGFMQVSNFRAKQSQSKQEDAAAQAEKVAAALYRANTPEQWAQTINYLKQTGHDISPEEENFANKDAVLGEFLSLKEQMAQGNADRSFNATENFRAATLGQKNEPKPPEPFTLGEGQKRFDAEGNEIAAGAPRPLGAAGSTASDIVTLNTDAIVSGNQPPDLKNLYRYGAPIKAELQKRGYNLVQAQEDWLAQTKMIATLNGPQQTRLRQATNFAYDSLPIIEDLAKQWDAGGYPLLNKARLAAAKQGALGAEAQTIATQLDTQIADLTSELGTVYKGGNSSTDESLKLAGKNLQADWSKDTLQKNIDLVRKNLDIRKNSLNLAVAGVGENRYAPKGELPTGDVESAFSDAKDAIEQGADPEAVKQELLDMGMDPELVDQGLQ